MTDPRSNRRHARRVGKLIADAHSKDTGVLDGIWHWVNGVASGIGHFIGGPIAGALKAIQVALKDIAEAYLDFITAVGRVVFFVEYHIVKVLRDWVVNQFRQQAAKEARDVRFLVGLISATVQYVLVYAVRMVRAETSARRADVQHAETRALREVRALHHTIEREAESGYRVERDARTNLVIRLLDFAVIRDPLLRDLVGTIVTGLLDLVSIDDPVGRLIAGFLIRQVIDRLGIDKAVGVLIRDLAGPLLGNPKPRNLHDVIMDMSSRMLAIESQQATFMEDGGAQVLQAGKDWRDITGVIGNAAVLAFTVQAVTAPDLWAREISDTIGAVANDTLTKAAALFWGH